GRGTQGATYLITTQTVLQTPEQVTVIQTWETSEAWWQRSGRRSSVQSEVNRYCGALPVGDCGEQAMDGLRRRVSHGWLTEPGSSLQPAGRSFRRRTSTQSPSRNIPPSQS